MLVKFSCDKHCLDFEKSELEILEQAQPFTHCAFCGQKLKIINLTEIVEQDIKERVKNEITRYINTLGLEGAIELIERYLHLSYIDLYIEEFKNRGWKINKNKGGIK